MGRGRRRECNGTTRGRCLTSDARTPFHWLGRARGYSKTTDLGGMAVAVLSGAGAGTGTAVRDRRRPGAGAASPRRDRRLHRKDTRTARGASRSRSSRSIAARSGATLDDLARRRRQRLGAAALVRRRRRADAVARDASHRPVWEGVTTGLAKVKGSRMAVLGTAGDPAHFSYGIATRRSTIRCGGSTRSKARPRGWTATARRRAPQAPGVELPRLFLNEWAASEDRLADEDDLAACLDARGLPARPAAREPGT